MIFTMIFTMKKCEKDWELVIYTKIKRKTKKTKNLLTSLASAYLGTVSMMYLSLKANEAWNMRSSLFPIYTMK